MDRAGFHAVGLVPATQREATLPPPLVAAGQGAVTPAGEGRRVKSQSQNQNHPIHSVSHADGYRHEDVHNMAIVICTKKKKRYRFLWIFCEEKVAL